MFRSKLSAVMCPPFRVQDIGLFRDRSSGMVGRPHPGKPFKMLHRCEVTEGQPPMYRGQTELEATSDAGHMTHELKVLLQVRGAQHLLREPQAITPIRVKIC